MILTICLVTKGRESFLGDALLSYEPFIKTGNVNVVLFDNGSDLKSKQILLDWTLKHEKSVFYSRNEINNPGGFTFFWDELKSLNPDWILNPGDDDILVFDVYRELLKELEKNPCLNAFASSAEVIDSSGESTGEVRIPAINGITSQTKMISSSIHQPPFIWPSLFFKFSAIETPVIRSRFAHDWWIGLQLILKGEVASTSSIGVKYRVHENQESFQVTNRRKYFEGFNMLTSVINSANFQEFLESKTDCELNELLELCIQTKPLYGQTEFYMSLLKDISFAISKALQSDTYSKSISELYTLSADIYIKSGDLDNLYTGLILDTTGSSGNFALVVESVSCEYLSNTQEYFNRYSNRKLYVYCRHSKRNKKGVFVDCKKLSKLNKIEIVDNLLIAVSSQLEKNGTFSFTLTPFERWLITFYRTFKYRLPKNFAKYLFDLKRNIVQRS